VFIFPVQADPDTIGILFPRENPKKYQVVEIEHPPKN
jgi:hypothetical protein